MPNKRQLDPNKPARELFGEYMHLISKKDSESTFHLTREYGEGIMRRYHIARGVEFIYSEIEHFVPSFQEQKQMVRYLEIMYLVDGHADFEMENRRIASADRGDVVLFHSQVATKKCLVGENGMRCISLVVFIDDLAEELNRFFETTVFEKDRLFAEVQKANSCIAFPANDLLGRTFNGLLQVPEEYGDQYRKLLTFQAILALLNVQDGKPGSDGYFSGDTGSKVHEARKLLSEDLSETKSIEELAGAVKLNRTSLQKVFRQMYGMTIKEYRMQIRMQEAKNLLLDESRSVTEIAGLCGYANASKFASSFRKIVGMSPVEWRRLKEYKK